MVCGTSKGRSRSARPFPIRIIAWTNDSITITVPNNTPTGELSITRGDNGKSTITAVTIVNREAKSNIHTVKPPSSFNPNKTVPTPITDMILATRPHPAT